MNKVSYKNILAKYEQDQRERKAKIRSKPTRWKRFWAWVWYLIAFPWIWIWINIRDWRTIVIFGIVMLVVGIEVWLPALLGLIFHSTEFGKWCLGVASACELFWLLPATPFIPLCIFITISIKSIINKRTSKQILSNNKD